MIICIHSYYDDSLKEYPVNNVNDLEQLMDSMGITPARVVGSATTFEQVVKNFCQYLSSYHLDAYIKRTPNIIR